MFPKKLTKSHGAARPLVAAILGTTMLIASAGSAISQDQPASERVPVVFDLGEWNPELYGGISAQRLIGTEVVGPNGDEIGVVSNLVMGPEGSLQKLVIATGGFLGIGDTFYAVPWQEATYTKLSNQVVLKVSDEGMDAYPIFPTEQVDQPEAARNWLASELLDDYASLSDVQDYGFVRDLVIDQDGAIEAVIVTPDRTYGNGFFAFPYERYSDNPGFEANRNYYVLSHTLDDIAENEAIEYPRLWDGVDQSMAD